MKKESSLNPYEIIYEQEEQNSFSYKLNQNQDSKKYPDTQAAIQANPNQKIIKKRVIKHQSNFGRGANHPSFFGRKFLNLIEKLSPQSLYYRYINYKEINQICPNPLQILKAIKKKISKLKDIKRFKIQHLQQLFGQGEDQEVNIQNYICAKIFYYFISQQSVEIVMLNRKCQQVLNHLISMQKYSARLVNPKLTGRVQFQ